jgi:hypothetical protein
VLISRTIASAAATGFVLPGTSFGITPIGFYLFSSYWAVFTSIVLSGAWNKRKVSTIEVLILIFSIEMLLDDGGQRS